MKHNGKPKAQGGGIDTAIGLELFRRMLRVRKFEERAEALAGSGELPGPRPPVHRAGGDRGGSVRQASRRRLRRPRPIAGMAMSSPRAAIWTGCMAELFGRDTGVCRGKGGSMHMADLGLGIIGANGIVAAGIPIALGCGAFGEAARDRSGRGRVLRRGRLERGSVPRGDESRCDLVPAGRLHVREQRLRPDSPGCRSVHLGHEIVSRAAPTRFRPSVSTGTTASRCYAAMTEAVARARAGDGPTLIEAITYRCASTQRDSRSCSLDPTACRDR